MKPRTVPSSLRLDDRERILVPNYGVPHTSLPVGSIIAQQYLDKPREASGNYKFLPPDNFYKKFVDSTVVDEYQVDASEDSSSERENKLSFYHRSSDKVWRKKTSVQGDGEVRILSMCNTEEAITQLGTDEVLTVLKDSPKERVFCMITEVVIFTTWKVSAEEESSSTRDGGVAVPLGDVAEAAANIAVNMTSIGSPAPVANNVGQVLNFSFSTGSETNDSIQHNYKVTVKAGEERIGLAKARVIELRSSQRGRPWLALKKAVFRDGGVGDPSMEDSFDILL